MTATIEEVIMDACDLPAVPDVANKVMKLLADPNTSSAMICRTISDDSALTARILKISNSAFYGCLRTINNLQSAIVIIGYSAIRSLVIAVSTKEVYKSFGLTERMLWEHSVGMGIASHILAKEAKISKVDDVFVCGLMHDIGKVIMNNSNRDLYNAVMERTYNEGITALEAEQDLFGFTHPEVGALVIKKWNLTDELEKAVQFHHNPTLVADEDEYILTLTAIINLADMICHRLGVGTKGPEEGIDVNGSESAKTLGFTGAQLDELIPVIEKNYKEEKNIFG
ncbi:MAG: HDOD domain-containing protein [Deltaproteobacteria bacterium]|nr:HDOD domain-containing protein [Deltaproteobacteria bacterium]